MLFKRGSVLWSWTRGLPSVPAVACGHLKMFWVLNSGDIQLNIAFCNRFLFHKGKNILLPKKAFSVKTKRKRWSIIVSSSKVRPCWTTAKLWLLASEAGTLTGARKNIAWYINLRRRCIKVDRKCLLLHILNGKHIFIKGTCNLRSFFLVYHTTYQTNQDDTTTSLAPLNWQT